MRTSTTIANQASVRMPANLIARIAGVFYVLNIIAGLYSYFAPRSRLTLYTGMVSAAVSMAGSTVGVLSLLQELLRLPKDLVRCFRWGVDLERLR